MLLSDLESSEQTFIHEKSISWRTMSNRKFAKIDETVLYVMDKYFSAFKIIPSEENIASFVRGIEQALPSRLNMEIIPRFKYYRGMTKVIDLTLMKRPTDSEINR